jgi:prevent-host-death family protein
MTIPIVRYDECIMKHRVVTATEFKAKCLALLDEVDDKGDSITVTKRGRPVATLQPVKKKPWKSPMGDWIGKVEIVGDIVNFDSSDLWDALRKDREDPI